MASCIHVRITTMDSEFDLDIQSNTTGDSLFETVLRTMGVREHWYFGLQYRDSKGTLQWLRREKKVTRHNIEKSLVLCIRFCVKVYPENVNELIQDVTRRLFYLEVRQQVLNGQLSCPAEIALLLASLQSQAKYGDYHEGLINEENEFLQADRLLPERIIDQYDLSREQWVEKVVQYHSKHGDMLREEAMIQYLRITQQLHLYGLTFFDIMNRKETELHLGVHSKGLSVFSWNDRLTAKVDLNWAEIKKLSYQRRKFIIKSNDASVNDLIFCTHSSKISKEILRLCMCNHDLFMKRRSNVVPDLEALKVSTEEDRRIKRETRDQISRERNLRVMLEEKVKETELKLLETSYMQTKINIDVDRYKERVTDLERLVVKIPNGKERLRIMEDKMKGSFDKERRAIDLPVPEIYAEDDLLDLTEDYLPCPPNLQYHSIDDQTKWNPQFVAEDAYSMGDSSNHEGSTTKDAVMESLVDSLRLELQLRRIQGKTDIMEKMHDDNKRMTKKKLFFLTRNAQEGIDTRIDAFEAL